MKLSIEDSNRRVTGHLEVSSALEQQKLHEVVLEQRPFIFKGDTKFARRWLQKLEANRAKMAKKAMEDEDYRNWLVEAEACATAALQSLTDDPTDSKHAYTKEQLDLREQRRRELQGEDLPGAHARLVQIIENHKNFEGPYLFTLQEDDILALVELVDVWATKNLPSNPAQPEEEEEDGPEMASGSVPTPDKLVLGDLMRILGILKSQCDTIRARRLVKTPTHTQVKVH